MAVVAVYSKVDIVYLFFIVPLPTMSYDDLSK